MAENIDNIVREGIQEPTSIDWQQGKTFGACLVEMFDRCLWTDIKFRCKDHEESGFIEAHKNVLAARSHVFQAMFFGPCADGKDVVVVNTVQSETLRLFLRYFYCDNVTLTEESAIAVLKMAHCYQFSSLVQYCADYLSTAVTPNNVCRLLSFAMQYQLINLESVCLIFMDNNAEEVLKSDGFMNLSTDCLVYILKGDTFYADEADIMDKVDRWSRRKVIERGLEETGTNIRKCLGESFYYLRLPTMTYKTLMECTSRKGYFSVEEYADVAAFINKIPDVIVSTNLCVERVPHLEIVNVNAKSQCELDSISSKFEISVKRDIAFSSIVLSVMKPCFGRLYTDNKCKSSVIDMNARCLQFRDQVIKMGLSNNQMQVLKHVKETDVQANPELILSGTVSFMKTKLCKFTRKLNLQQCLGNEKIIFDQPLKLNENSHPYIVDINIQSSCANILQIKTMCNNFEKCIQCVSGNVKISCSKYGSFAGIERFEFLNFPNRDINDKRASEPTEEKTQTSDHAGENN